MSEMFMTMPQKTNDYYNHIISSLFFLFEALKRPKEKLQKNIKWIIELDKHLKQCVWSF